jgi:hypothetical protein
MPSHLCLAHYGPGLIRYQTGARIVRRAQEQAGPEYIRPGTASSKQAVTPAAIEVHNNVRWFILIWGWKHNPQGSDLTFMAVPPITSGNLPFGPLILLREDFLGCE